MGYTIDFKFSFTLNLKTVFSCLKAFIDTCNLKVNSAKIKIMAVNHHTGFLQNSFFKKYCEIHVPYAIWKIPLPKNLFKRTPAQEFSFEYCKIVDNIYFLEQLRVTSSAFYRLLTHRNFEG